MRIAILFLTTALLLPADPQSERVQWNHAATAFAGRSVEVKLTSGTRIRGAWNWVTPDSFTMRVEKTSNGREYRKGVQTVPRSLIAEVRVGERRVRGRWIGSLAGFYSIAAIGAAASRSPEALQGAIGIAAYAGGFAGYFIGRSYDYETHPVILYD